MHHERRGLITMDPLTIQPQYWLEVLVIEPPAEAVLEVALEEADRALSSPYGPSLPFQVKHGY